MFHSILEVGLLFGALSSAANIKGKSCKCVPSESCWPSANDWDALNNTVSGRLIANQPLAISCYPGPSQNVGMCALVDTEWTNATFQADSPVGISYPTNITCPPINVTAGESPMSCSLGTSPTYAVNATSPDHVSAAIVFAKNYNIRFVIKNTGHDLLGRSEGADGLEVWIRHLRQGITFQDTFESETTCKASNWTGNAFKIGGGYSWHDVYPEAQSRNVIVVGGGTPSVSALGGWMQGGGHGPASRQFGLGADQVLEATVVLANGTIVTANACQNSDLYFAIRGGGPGTYGIVISTTVKAWPMISNAAVQHLAIAPLTDNTSALLDAVSILYSSYPDLNDAGFAGYGTWGIEAVTPFFANFYAGYEHGFYMFDKSVDDARAAFDSVRIRLVPYNGTSLFVSETYISYSDYWSFYLDESGVEPSVGSESALGSRLFDKASVQGNFSSLRAMVEVLAGNPGEYTVNNQELISGGRVFEDESDPDSGLNPAWRKSYFNHIVARGWPTGTNESVKAALHADITFNKVAAMNKQAPDTGVYMNEADRLDPNYEVNFYGNHYSMLRDIKASYDPDDLFYCPTCVGSGEWEVSSSGQLCPKS